jgi:hypothetical protein
MPDSQETKIWYIPVPNGVSWFVRLLLGGLYQFGFRRVSLKIRIFGRWQGAGARRSTVYTPVHEHSSTTATPPAGKKTIFRGALT